MGRPIGRGRGGGILNLVLMGFLRASPKGKLIMLAIGAVAFLFFREPVMQLLSPDSAVPSGSRITENPRVADTNDTMGQYLKTMMADNETIWPALLAKHQIQFRPAKMIIYTGSTQTLGGIANSRMGPFYAPAENAIYLDPTFFTELKTRFGATGDFAEAYVIAHEYAHHIQNVLGRLKQLHSQRSRLSEKQFNRGSVRVELHADFLAGIFARHAENTFQAFLEQGDIEEAIRAAAAVGDDRIQRDFGPGYVDPDSFTHGSSEQRARWFKRGFQSGDMALGEQIYTMPYEEL